MGPNYDCWPDWAGRTTAPRRGMTPRLPGLLDDATLLRMMRDGWTFEEIHQACGHATGHFLTQTGLLLALCGIARSLPTADRTYRDHLPWRVLSAHRRHPALSLLRCLGWRAVGVPLPAHDLARLDPWLATLRRQRRVVAYVPPSTVGFWYVDESWRSGPNPSLPVRVLRMSWEPEGAVVELDPELPPE